MKTGGKKICLVSKTVIMPSTKTKRLARKLGLIQHSKKRRPDPEVGEQGDGATSTKKRRKRNGQLLSYLIVIDFESTCWENKRGFQEIIEFPAVLLDLLTGKIVDEFQQYVLPRDNPKLSDFCKTLTGISQEQVDNGVPLATCLYLFGCWVRKITEERGVVIMEPGKEYSEEMLLCALATWSDWDLEVCLNYECRRKQIRKPNYFNQWIDVRAIYKKFYDQKPSGLSGAMEDLGIVFTGRQHSGIDDARNTAKLCYRMVRDGCRMDITKCIQSRPNPGTIRPPLSTTTTSACVNTEQSSTKPVFHCKESSPLAEQENVPSNCRDKASPESSKPVITLPTLADDVNTISDKNYSNKPPKNGQVEHSHDAKTVVTDEAEDKWDSFDEDLMKDIVRELDDWDNDDPASERLLGANQPSTTHKEHHVNSHGVSRPSTCSDIINIQPVLLKSQPVQENARLSAGTPSRSDFVSHIAPATLLSCPRYYDSGEKSAQSPIACDSSSKIQSTCSNASSEVCVVKETLPYSAASATNHQTKLSYSGSTAHHTTHPQNQTASSFDHIRTHTPTAFTPQASPNRSKSTHPTTALQRSCETPNSVLSFRTPSTSEWMKVKRLSCGSTHTPSPSSTHTPLPGSTHNPSSSLSGRISGELLLSNGGKVTPPLCNCGKRTKRRTVSTPGPNEGQTFYACPNGKASDKSRGCGYFKWEKMLASRSSCSPQSFTTSYSRTNIMSCNMLEPEYFESKR